MMDQNQSKKEVRKVRQTRRLATMAILVLVLVIGLTTTISAAPSIKWYVNNVYYDDQGNLAVAGYFYNDGTRTVTWVNRINLQVYFRTSGNGWWLKTRATFEDLNVNIRPGEISRWTLRITDVDYSYFDYWYVDWQADYTYH
jgi:hypothetical protein